MEIQNLLNETKNKLNKISPSLCAAKWERLTLYLYNGYNHSCHHPIPHKIPLEEVKNNPAALHNTLFKKNVRKQMCNGIQPSECSYCWEVEKLGQTSDRIYKSSYDYSQKFLEQIETKTITELTEQDYYPSYVEIAFDNTCNFKCMYCGPAISSSIYQDILLNGPYPVKTFNNDIENVKEKLPTKESAKVYSNAFWKWWPTLKDKLHTLRITGGEPLLSKDMWKLLDAIISDPLPNINICINTNLGQRPELINKFIHKCNQLENKVKSLTIYHSIDTGIPHHAEYIRKGLDYRLYCNNLENLCENINWPVNIICMITVTNISAIGLQALLKYIFALRSQFCNIHNISFETTHLHDPEFMQVRLGNDYTTTYINNALTFVKNITAEHRLKDAPLDLQNIYKKYYKQFPYFTEKNFLKMKRLLSFTQSNFTKEKETFLKKEFNSFFQEYDKRHNLNFTKTFPEIKDFFHLN